MHLRVPGEELSLSPVLLSMVSLSHWVGRVTDSLCFSGSGCEPPLPNSMGSVLQCAQCPAPWLSPEAAQ